ncbi:hypothetical protein FRC07_002412 [Ceratobasidium sp. 392]|nr:hypothetical protein FRC07_002412 [Ceratobasidium sp. 392]
MANEPQRTTTEVDENTRLQNLMRNCVCFIPDVLGLGLDGIVDEPQSSVVQGQSMTTSRGRTPLVHQKPRQETASEERERHTNSSLDSLDTNSAAHVVPARSLSYPPPSQSSPIITERKRSLLKSLTGTDLSASLAPIGVIAIGVNDEDLPGAVHDVEWLRKTLQVSVFRALTGGRATKAGIRDELKRLLRNAGALVAIFLHFTGHSSNADNSFLLSDGQSLGAAALFEWIEEFRTPSDEPLPVIISFDCCRKNNSIPVPIHGLKNVCVVWGCSLGESSFDMNFGNSLPRSDLLKSVCLALNEIGAHSAGFFDFMGRVRTHLSQLMKIHRARACGLAGCDISWNTCICAECLRGGLCLHEKHEEGDSLPIQNPLAWFSVPGSDTDDNDVPPSNLLRLLQPIHGYVKDAICKAANDIVECKWYTKFVCNKSRFRILLEQVLREPGTIEVVVLYFAGHGDKSTNALILGDGQTIAEREVHDQIVKYRPESGKRLPIIIVFDFCRENRDVPLTSFDDLDGVYVIWGCEPGQRCYECDLDGSLPCSNLLKVLCLVLHVPSSGVDINAETFMELVAAYALDVTELARAKLCAYYQCSSYLRPKPLSGEWWMHGIHDKKCFSRGMLQNPVGRFSGFPDNAVLHAAQPIFEIIKGPIKKVAAGIEEMYRMWVPQVDADSSRGSSQPNVSSTRRGASACVVAA